MFSECEKPDYRYRQTKRIRDETQRHYRRIYGALLIGAIVVVWLWCRRSKSGGFLLR